MELEVNYTNNILFKLSNNKIYSFLGDSNSIANSLSIQIFNEFKNKKIKVGYVKSELYNMFNHELVIDNFKENLKKYNYKTDKRILESLKIVGLDDSILNKKYYELKYIELKKVSLALILVYNPRVIILENYSEGLNNKDKNELIRLFRILKNKYKRIIILISKDTDFCYSISDYFYLLDKNGIVKQGNKTLINNTELLNKLNLKTPDIVKFINEYRKYNKEFSDYTNILDLIKAVYRDIGYKR